MSAALASLFVAAGSACAENKAKPEATVRPVIVRIASTPVPTPKPKRTARPSPPEIPIPARRPGRVVRPTGGSVHAIIHHVFGAHGASAVRVADCESNLRPGAVNGPHRGLFQINVGIHAGRIASHGYTADDMFSAEPNARVAKSLFDAVGQDWTPTWTCGWAA